MVFMKLILAAHLQLTAYSSRQNALITCYFFSIFVFTYFIGFLIWIFFNTHHPNFWIGVLRHLAKYSFLTAEVNFDRFYSRSHFLIILINKFLLCCFSLVPKISNVANFIALSGSVPSCLSLSCY